MVYRVREIRLDDFGRVIWEGSRRTDYRSKQPCLLGQVIERKVRGKVRLYRVETGRIEKGDLQ